MAASFDGLVMANHCPIAHCSHSVKRSEKCISGLGWFKNPVSSQTEKLMAATNFSDYLGLNHYKNAKKLKHFIHLRLANRPQSFAT